MYAGRIREYGTLDQVYKEPKHPYTVGLLNSVPTLDLDANLRLEPIRGEIPNLADLPEGCAFIDRCDYAVPLCEKSDPELIEIDSAHFGACWEHERVDRIIPGVTS
jgi:oligopeptide transport system ATP-binding protein